MFERLTDRARRVVVLAAEAAQELNHPYIGTEHLLLGLLHEGEGVAAVALGSLDVSLEEARRHVVKEAPPFDTPITLPQDPYTPRAKKVFELSLREALQLGHNYIGTEHILLGLIREGEGVAARVLVKEMDVELHVARRAVVDLLRGYDHPPVLHPPPPVDPVHLAASMLLQELGPYNRAFSRKIRHRITELSTALVEAQP